MIPYVSESAEGNPQSHSIRRPFSSHIATGTTGPEFRFVQVGSFNNRFHFPVHAVFRVMVHQTVLNWHEENVKRDKKASASAEEIDHGQAVADSTDLDSD